MKNEVKHSPTGQFYAEDHLSDHDAIVFYNSKGEEVGFIKRFVASRSISRHAFINEGYKYGLYFGAEDEMKTLHSTIYSKEAAYEYAFSYLEGNE